MSDFPAWAELIAYSDFYDYDYTEHPYDSDWGMSSLGLVTGEWQATYSPEEHHTRYGHCMEYGVFLISENGGPLDGFYCGGCGMGFDRPRTWTFANPDFYKLGLHLEEYA